MEGVIPSQKGAADQVPDSDTRSTGDARVPWVGERIALPASFGRRFVIFADAEEEFDWTKPFARDNTSTTAIAGLPEATKRFNAAGVKPSYLVDYPVMNNEPSANIIRALLADDACDIGTQLHPWVSPPFDETVSNQNSFTKNLPVEPQRAKLITLTDKIEEVTGIRPTVYRAGRYGVGVHTMQHLTEAGYRMDVSVRARWNYSSYDGPDFADHPVWPWRYNDQLIELPLSTAWTGPFRHLSSRKRFATHVPGLLARLGLLRKIGLTPEGFPLADAIDAIKALADEGLEMFSLSFHTPSVVIGHTPYVRSETDLSRFWTWWDGVFNQFAKMGITPVRQGEIISAADSVK
jgi:peptidoglycan/xylan/chitin deacetylase (PgdA/CDA1 family)